MTAIVAPAHPSSRRHSIAASSSFARVIRLRSCCGARGFRFVGIDPRIVTDGDVLRSRSVDAPPQEPPYVYAATDIRPRQTKEIELCEKASHFDWQYTGAFLAGVAGSVWLNIDHLKFTESPATRLIGPGLVGFSWGGLLSGGYLSLPKCDPLWAYGPPPEGNVRLQWPIATVITVISAVSAPIVDYTFLGPVRIGWEVSERSARVFVAASAGILGSLFPYVLPPRTWAAAKEIERMRVEGTPGGGAQLSYVRAF
jgi:hypothetical protein